MPDKDPKPFTPLEAAIEILAKKEYDLVAIATYKSPGETDSYKVCQAGRRNQRNIIVVHEDNKGNYLFYVPIRGNAGEQVDSLARWLAENSE